VARYVETGLSKEMKHVMTIIMCLWMDALSYVYSNKTTSVINLPRFAKNVIMPRKKELRNVTTGTKIKKTDAINVTLSLDITVLVLHQFVLLFVETD